MLNYKTVTIIFYGESSLEIQYQVSQFELSNEGRVIIPDSFKAGKSIIAVCDGAINILNKLGDRIIPMNNIIIQPKDLTKIAS